MRLSQFILSNTEQIIAEFETFARTIDHSMDVDALRDHAKQMLHVVAHDLETPQTSSQEKDKSEGLTDANNTSPNTPAQEHGAGRALSGFTVAQMVSEYRALRASVIRLWLAQPSELKPSDFDDLVRFSEAIDQALAESTSRFMSDLDQTRDIFLGIIGHDLRTPLGAIMTASQFLLEEGDLPPVATRLTGTIAHSAARMNAMVADLADFTRSRLGMAMSLQRREIDAAELIKDAVAEINAARPEAQLRLKAVGDMRGEWDAPRLSQVLSNLLSNAINHGSANTPITILARGDTDTITFSVHNEGRAIPTDQIRQIFNPLTQGSTGERDPSHLGLGLYITRQIVEAHGGSIEVESAEDVGTTFTVNLPRHNVPA